MEKTKNLWFRVGINFSLTEEEYLAVCKGGQDGADEASNEAAMQILIEKMRTASYCMSGEAYSPQTDSSSDKEWPRPVELNFDFDVQMEPQSPEKMQIKIIDDNGNYTIALADSKQPIEVEFVRIDKDYEDYDQLRDYSKKLQKDLQYHECDVVFAYFEPEDGPNTKISYLYRDGGNYKVWNEVVIKGELSAEQIERILECADGDGWLDGSFIPSRIGLPEKTMEDEGFSYDEELDTPWFEIDEDGFESTEEDPTVDMTPEELVAAFERCAGHWQNPTSDPVKMATIHFTSVEEGASATQFDTQDCGDLMELFHGFLNENKLTLVRIDSVEFCEGTA